MKQQTCSHTEGPQHSCELVERVNALIPIAEQKTNQHDFLREEEVSSDGRMGRKERQLMWDAIFHQTMDELAEAVGIRRRIV